MIKNCWFSICALINHTKSEHIAKTAIVTLMYISFLMLSNHLSVINSKNFKNRFII